ncbi:MAG: 3-oxoacyl-ACP reductase FabG [Vicinamibacterales bacterium]|nr:3-oxoacyl-ACP reductase FabG [Vicinamibacterales bacterium]
MFDRTGQVALVTGASRGIGRAIASRLAAQGATVVAAARGDHAGATVLELTSQGHRAEAMSLDVTDAEALARVPAEIVRRHGRLDVIVSNAGIARDQLLMRMKREDWDAVIDTNLTAAFTCVQAVLKTMVRQRSGRIINMSSVVGETGNAGQVNYAASKAGLIGFTKALAKEVGSRKITVNAVTPGLIETEMTQAIAEKAHADWASQVPLGRIGTPADVAAAVCFLASDEAAYITGHVLAVNGGMYM